MIGIPAPNALCDYKIEQTEVEPSFKITLPAIAAAGSNIIKSPISNPKKKRKKWGRNIKINFNPFFPEAEDKPKRVAGVGKWEKFISNLCLSGERRKD